MNADDPRHGTYAGASEHRDTRTPICAPCLRAERIAHAQALADRLAGRPRTLPAIGTVRRIQALQAMGWTIAEIARQSGLYEKTLRNPMYRGASVYRGTAEAVAETYERLCMVRPIGPYPERCRRMAARRGYAPPLAWDDIDNPAEHPQGVGVDTPLEAARRRQQETPNDVDPGTVERLMAGETVPATRAERLEVLRRWVADGGSQNALERLHGWNVQRDLRRARANDNDDGKAA